MEVWSGIKISGNVNVQLELSTMVISVCLTLVLMAEPGMKRWDLANVQMVKYIWWEYVFLQELIVTMVRYGIQQSTPVHVLKAHLLVFINVIRFPSVEMERSIIPWIINVNVHTVWSSTTLDVWSLPVQIMSIGMAINVWWSTVLQVPTIRTSNACMSQPLKINVEFNITGMVKHAIIININVLMALTGMDLCVSLQVHVNKATIKIMMGIV